MSAKPPSPAKRPSLSAVDRLLAALRLLRAGNFEPESDWLTFALSSAEHTDFEARLRQDAKLSGWYEDKVRYDWASEEEKQGDGGGRGRYTLRVPSARHERLIADVEEIVVAGIRELADSLERDGGGHGDGEACAMKKVAEELRKVRKGRSTTVEMRCSTREMSSQDSAVGRKEEEAEAEAEAEDGREKLVRRSPDATFYHPSQPDLPCLVVEASDGQQRKLLPILAASYIMDSQHAIRCVVGLDIKPPLPPRKNRKMADETMDKPATLSVWRPGVEESDGGDEVETCRTDLDAVMVRDARGNPSDGALTLRLADLLPPSVLADLPEYAAQPTITIPLSTFSSCLTYAEQSAPITTAQTSSAPKKFRKRKRTPSEELSDGKAAEFLAQEDAVAREDHSTDHERPMRSRRTAGDECQ